MNRFLRALIFLSVPCLLTAQERDLDWVIDRYVEAAGGRVNLKDLTSVVIEGTLTVEDQSSLSIKVMKKRPNFVRQVMQHKNGRREVIAYNGEKAWQISSDRRREQFTILPEETAKAFIRDAKLENPLSADSFDRSLINYKGVTTIEDSVECHHVEITYPDGYLAKFYIDTRSFLERKTIKIETKPDGTTLTTETFPSDFQFYNGVLFAQRIVIRRDDGYSSILTIDKIRINPGVPSNLFNPPPGY